MKNLTLKALAFASVMLMGFGASAQVAGTDYVQYDANLLAPTNIDYVTLKTGGTTMGYYAKPDPLYHPSYVAPGWALTADFVWDWTVAPAMATAKPGAANYVEITYTATGNYVVNVAEHAPAAMGGCVDATPTVMNVTVVAAPTATATISPAAPWVQIGATPSYQACGDMPAEPVTITFTENVPNALGAYSFAIARKVENLDGADAVIATPTAYTIVSDFTAAAKAKTGTAGFTAATPSFTYVFNTVALDLVPVGANDARTKYTYKIVRTGTLAAAVEASTDNDFRSAISAKSDYLGAASYYDFTNFEVSFIVNPTPATGPIYHIANTFAY